MCRPAISIPSGAMTRRARGMVKTGVRRKFSRRQILRYDSEFSTSAIE